MKLKKQVIVFDTESIVSDARLFYAQLGDHLHNIPPECPVTIELSGVDEFTGNLQMWYSRLETDFEEQERIKRSEEINKNRLVEQQRKVDNDLKELARLKALYEVKT